VGNFKSAIATAQNAYDNFTAINRQIAETVEKNVATAQAATSRTKKRAKK